MERRPLQGLSKLKAPYLRRATLLLLALMYLFVGLGNVAFCTDETVAATVFSQVGTVTGTASDEGDSTKAPILAEHCPVCTPVVMPTSMPLASPMEHPVKIAFVAPQRLLEDPPKLDTPPPKHLT